MSFQNSKSRAKSASLTIKGLGRITCFGFRIKTNIVSCYHCLYQEPLAHMLLQQDAATDRCRRSSYSKSLMQCFSSTSVKACSESPDLILPWGASRRSCSSPCVSHFLILLQLCMTFLPDARQLSHCCFIQTSKTTWCFCIWTSD